MSVTKVSDKEVETKIRREETNVENNKIYRTREKLQG
jgi:hypothetical protein